MKLFIPGPVTVRQDVLNEMAKQMIGHRTKDASKLQKDITEKMQKIFGTKNQVLLSTSSGSGLMEGAIRSCTLKRAACFAIGDFGEKWYKMAINNNTPADLFKSELGDITTPEQVDEVLKTGKYDLITVTGNETTTGIANPIKEIGEIVKKYDDVIFCVDYVSSAGGVKIDADDFGVDIAITSSQKSLGLPPGLAFCTFSPKAEDRAKKVENRGSYFDLLNLKSFIDKKDNQYPTTPALSLMYAANVQLDYILNEQTLEKRIQNHKDMADLVRTWAKKHFDLFATEETYASNTVTCIKNTKNIDVANLIKELKKQDILLGNGYGDLKDKTFRIAHMADFNIDDMQDLLNRIDNILGF